jgi:lysophospholipase L1-like esterase
MTPPNLPLVRGRVNLKQVFERLFEKISMSDLWFLAMSLLTQKGMQTAEVKIVSRAAPVAIAPLSEILPVPAQPLIDIPRAETMQVAQFIRSQQHSSQPEESESYSLVSDRPPSDPATPPHLFDPATIAKLRPYSGSQLYQQRLAALSVGTIYTRLPANSFWERWIYAIEQPTYEQWIELLAQEARVVAWGQGNNRLTILVGDSLSMWFPVEWVPTDRFWLNQGISGDTTGGVLKRLSHFSQTQPDLIHVMVGINDLKRGVPPEEVLSNLRQIMRQLRQTHPSAQIMVHSLLPTRTAAIPNQQVYQVNQHLPMIAQQEGVSYLDLTTYFADPQGAMRPDLTTDGLHLNWQGYAVWEWVMRSIVVALGY